MKQGPQEETSRTGKLRIGFTQMGVGVGNKLPSPVVEADTLAPLQTQLGELLQSGQEALLYTEGGGGGEQAAQPGSGSLLPDGLGDLLSRVVRDGIKLSQPGAGDPSPVLLIADSGYAPASHHASREAGGGDASWDSDALWLRALQVRLFLCPLWRHSSSSPVKRSQQVGSVQFARRGEKMFVSLLAAACLTGVAMRSQLSSVATTTAATPGGAGRGYTAWVLLPEAVTQERAAKACREEGSALASLRSVGENEFVLRSFAGAAGAWTGLAWSSGAALEWEWAWGDGSPAPYRNWSEGEPRGLAGTPRCAEVLLGGSRAGAWGTLSCKEERAALCRRDVIPTSSTEVMSSSAELTEPTEPTEPTTTPTAGSGSTTPARQGALYLVTPGLPWAQARLYCERRLGGGLAAAPDPPSQQRLARFLGNQTAGPGRFWIGLRWAALPSRWVWAGGPAGADIAGWAPGQPRREGAGMCAAAGGGGGFALASECCATRLPFVCCGSEPGGVL
ncbi:uncharacterized protein [Lepisosteus oculatus]|uniref:uncharacterized protein n=1 Tax=Lepisosteus oculatus TaxID=7918 RepID=UPI0035F520AC